MTLSSDAGDQEQILVSGMKEATGDPAEGLFRAALEPEVQMEYTEESTSVW